MARKKNEILETKETVEDLKDETVETKKEETPVTEEIKPVEEEIVVVSGKSGISKDMYLEFFSVQLNSGRSVRQTAFFCALMCVYLYLFKTTDDTPASLLIKMGISCGIIVAITFIFNLITRYVIAPKNYDKSGLNTLNIDFDFSNLGIRQSIIDEKGEKQTGLLYWTEVMKAIETPNSFFFLSQRNGLLCSKEKFTEEENLRIAALVEEKLGNRFQRKLPKEKAEAK